MAETKTATETYAPNLVADIADGGEYLWLASDAGLVKFNKATGERTYYTEDNSDIPSDNTRSVAVVDGDVWVGTLGHGIGIFNGSTWDSLTTSNSDLAVDYGINDILVTDENGIWIANGLWVSHLKDGVWGSYQVLDIGDSYNVLSVARDSIGTIWIGTSYGLYSLQDGEAALYDTVPQGSISNIIVSQDSSLWFGIYSHGLYKKFGNEITSYSTDNSDIPFTHISAVAFDSSNRLWFGGSAFAVFDNGFGQQYDTDDCEDLQVVGCIHCDDGVMWIGTNHNGLIRFDGETWTQYDIIPSITAVEKSETPSAIDLLPAYPNPFNPQTTISYTLPEAVNVTLSVHSVTGQQVAVLVDEYVSAGSHSAVFNGEGLSSGIYFYRLESAGVVKTGRMALVK